MMTEAGIMYSSNGDTFPSILGTSTTVRDGRANTGMQYLVTNGVKASYSRDTHTVGRIKVLLHYQLRGAAPGANNTKPFDTGLLDPLNDNVVRPMWQTWCTAVAGAGACPASLVGISAGGQPSTIP
jgi:hypothetical protein